MTEERAHVREGGLQLPESAQHAGTYFPVADHYFTTCIKVKWGEGVQTVWGSKHRAAFHLHTIELLLTLSLVSTHVNITRG